MSARLRTLIASLSVTVLFATAAQPAPAAAPTAQERFASVEEAVKALVDAARAQDTSRLIRILGPDSKNVVSSGDPVADQTARERFAAAYDEASKVTDVKIGRAHV